MSIDRWVHISEMGSNQWVLPIWASINQAVIDKRAHKPNQSLFDLGLSLTTHLNMIPRIGCRLEGGLISLRDNVLNVLEEDAIYTNSKQGYALRINDDLKYELLIDIASFLFEVNIVWELQKKLFNSIRNWAEYPVTGILGVEIQKVVGGNDWFPLLDNLRNFFMHEGAPYIAFDATNGSKMLELIIMKENIHDFNDPDTFIKLDSLNRIADGFSSSKTSLQIYLINLINNMGRQ